MAIKIVRVCRLGHVMMNTNYQNFQSLIVANVIFWIFHISHILHMHSDRCSAAMNLSKNK